MKKTHGSYSKRSRHLTKKGRRTAMQTLRSFATGDHVRIDAFSGAKEGRPFLRFNRLIAEVVGRQGRAYKLKVRTGGKYKQLVVSSVHLEPFQSKVEAKPVKKTAPAKKAVAAKATA